MLDGEAVVEAQLIGDEHLLHVGGRPVGEAQQIHSGRFGEPRTDELHALLHAGIAVPIDELRIEPDYPNLTRALEQCEFKSLLQEIRDEAARIGSGAQGNLL